MRISDAVSPARPLTVPFDSGQELKVEYRPLSYTVEQLDALAGDSKNTARIIDTMVKLLVSWDLTDDDGEPIALDSESLRHIPTSIFTEIMRAVKVDQEAGEAPAPSPAA